MADESVGTIKVKFNGQLLQLDGFSKESPIGSLKEKLYELTNVPPKNQKLLGLVVERGQILSDELPLKYLVLKPTTKLMLMGSTDEERNKVIELSNIEPSDVIDDYDFTEEDLAVFMRPENLEKLAKRCNTYKFVKIAEFRLGKRLLVLDIDYTIFDHLTPAESVKHLMRPYLIPFLTRAYEFYDIAIWSATSMTWILAKISQMDLISQTIVNRVRQRRVDADNEDPNFVPNLGADLEDMDRPFKICLLVDSGAMISVNLPDHGVKGVKPLAVIWRKFPQFGPHNTIMFDDVRRNFAMNPGSGLRIHSYRDANVNYAEDRELEHLADYLELIALRETDFQRLNHDKWSHYVEKHQRYLSNHQKRTSDEATEGNCEGQDQKRPSLS
ncbi:Ubiquitin-like domain-containing CTD phosphatase 1 [Echinococcus granulosus]|nr:Ubiquitin-like domain-containing CTD phosphatase 1 [Echinococcus granulosus]